MRELPLSSVIKLTQIHLDAGNTPAIFGPPGIGKTEIARRIAESYGLKLVIINAATIAREDFALPVHNSESGKLKFVSHDFNNTVLLLDEFTNTSPNVRAALLSLITEHRINDIYFDNLKIIVTGNRIEDSALAQPLDSPTINRFAIFHMAPPTKKEWAVYMASHGNGHPMYTQFVVEKLPYGLFMGKVEPEVVEYTPFPTPRSHTSVARVLQKSYGETGTDLTKLNNEELDTVFALVESLVGTQVAQDFIKYLKDASSMFTMRQLRNGEIPNNSEQVYYLLYDAANSLNKPLPWWEKNLNSEEGMQAILDIAVFIQRLLSIPDKVESNAKKSELNRSVAIFPRFVFPPAYTTRDSSILEIIKMRVHQVSKNLSEGNLDFVPTEMVQEVEELFSDGAKLSAFVKRTSGNLA